MHKDTNVNLMAFLKQESKHVCSVLFGLLFPNYWLNRVGLEGEVGGRGFCLFWVLFQA